MEKRKNGKREKREKKKKRKRKKEKKKKRKKEKKKKRKKVQCSFTSAPAKGLSKSMPFSEAA